MSEVGTMVRIGIVSSRNTGDKLVRCFFPDMDDMASEWLYVLQRPGHSDMPSVNDRVLVLYPYGWDMDGFVLGVIP